MFGLDGTTGVEYLAEQFKSRYFPPIDIALLFMHAGEKDQAIYWLEKAYVKRDPRLHFVGVDPAWESFRSHPGFVRLLKDMGLRK